MLRKLIAATLFFAGAAFTNVKAQQLINDQIDVIAGAGKYMLNCVIYKPANFDPAKKYPLVLFFHGMGEAGTDVNKMYNNGLPKVLKGGYKPPFDFIMVAPQHNSYSVDPNHLQQILTECYAKFSNIDTTRIYLTGLSAGGNTIFCSALNINKELPKRFAGMVVMSGAAQGAKKANFPWWKEFKTPLWAVVGNNDVSYRGMSQDIVNGVNGQVSGLAEITIRPGVGHGGWNDVYNGSVKTANGKDMWQYLYQFRRVNGQIVSSSASIVTPPSTAPAAPATGSARILFDFGNDLSTTDQWGKFWNNMADVKTGVVLSNAKTSTNTASTVSLQIVNRIDGTFSPSGKGVNNGSTNGIVNDYPANATSDYAFAHKTATGGKWRFYGLNAQKTYVIKFWGTKTSTANYTIQIKRSDETAWKEYNASGNKNYATAATFTFTGKTEMSFDIRTKAGSDFGYISVVDITESASGSGGTPTEDGTSTPPPPATNKTPTVNAGADKTLTLPTNSLTLTGTAADQDGSVVQYTWAKVSGPAPFAINNAGIAAPVISNLVAGTYIFRLTVKDNGGATASDDVNVVVNAQAGGGTGTSQNLKFNALGDAYYPNATGLSVKPGDTIYIPAGNYGLVDLGNIRGTADKPIIIRNKGGLVTIRQVRLNNKMEYFKILGNGVPGLTYGIKIHNTTKDIAFAAASVSDMEVAYVEVSQGAVGMMVKKNPVAGDPSTQYGNYRIKNIKLHHNYIHDTDTEGMYIGSTSPSGTAAGIPIRLENVEISFNTLERLGWDGIQMSTSIGTNSIHDNVVRNFGTKKTSAQQTGIAIGGAATGDIYNNTIINGSGWGINAMGFGRIRIYNNNIENAGQTGIDKGSESIFADDRKTGPETFAKQEIIIQNNTIKNPQPRGAIRVGAYNKNSLPSTITGNKIYMNNAPANWIALYVVSNAVGSSILSNTLLGL